MEEYWNNVNSNAIDPQLMAMNSHYTFKSDPNLMSSNQVAMNSQQGIYINNYKGHYN